MLWNIYADLKDANYQLVDAPAFERWSRASGIDADSTVVFYGYAPAMGVWLMKLYGHRGCRGCSNCCARRVGERRPAVDDELPAPRPLTTGSAPRTSEIRARPRLTVRRGDQLTHDGHRSTSGLVAEYDGERFWPSGGREPGGRAGHVPSACAFAASTGCATSEVRSSQSPELRAVFGVVDGSTKSSPTARSAAVRARRGSCSPSCSAAATSASTTARGPSGAGRPEVAVTQPLFRLKLKEISHVRISFARVSTHPKKFARSKAAPASSTWSTSTHGAVGRATFMPGWRWSEHVKPIAKTDSCQAAHLGYFVSGRMTVVMDDGEELEYGPGDFADMAPGHDAWIVGDEPCVVVDWQGYADYAKR